MAYDAEKQKLREFAYWAMRFFRCEFCKKPMLDLDTAQRQGYGHRRHTSFVTLFTIHHRDENRENNSIANTPIAHPECHKRYHNQKRGGVNVKERKSGEFQESET